MKFSSASSTPPVCTMHKALAREAPMAWVSVTKSFAMPSSLMLLAWL